MTARRILVVDDNHDSAESLAMLLDLDGNETLVAHDGVEAMQAAATFKPDVMLVDLELPKLNGYQVARKVRQSLSGDEVRLVALTGWNEDGCRADSEAAGFDAHFVKPIDHAALTKLLSGYAAAKVATSTA
ncbi:MAG TPA: response regulator [Burkholderiaceae bacterium]|jgi:CheY-like chemotaxis protein|nr:response regulator [Burkholderiaceae bacterium]